MAGNRGALIVVALGAAIALNGCVLISKDGPEGDTVAAGAAVASDTGALKVGYALVDLDADAVRAANQYSRNAIQRFSGLKRRGGRDLSIGVGDIVSVTVFEAESGGLFIPKDAASRPGNYVQIPNEQVDARGDITIPYVSGPLHVAGRTAEDVSKEITDKLQDKAIKPQAVVSIVEHRGNDVSVLGEVATPIRFSIDPGGIRLSGAIARAGGAKYPSYETLVNLKRDGAVQTAELTAVVKEPPQDVWLAPGDVVYLSHEPRVYMVLGATPSPGAVGGINNRRFTFENEDMTLAEAISKAGGLDSSRSNPEDLFLFRFENPELLASLGVDVSNFHTPLIPTVYKVDFSAADGFFLSSKFNLRDKDVIFVAEAADADINKVLAIATNASLTGYYSTGAANNVRLLDK